MLAIVVMVMCGFLAMLVVKVWHGQDNEFCSDVGLMAVAHRLQLSLLNQPQEIIPRTCFLRIFHKYIINGLCIYLLSCPNVDFAVLQVLDGSTPRNVCMLHNFKKFHSRNFFYVAQIFNI